MAHWDDDAPFFRPERDRKEVVAEQLARLVTPDTSDSPAVKARKDRESAERLRRQDLMFGVYPGCTLGVPWSAGDDADVG